MNPIPKTATEGEEAVLRAFSLACPRPTAADVVEWTGSHPAHAEAIREVAEIALRFAQIEKAGLVPRRRLRPRPSPGSSPGRPHRAAGLPRARPRP